MQTSLYRVAADARAMLDDDESFDPETGELSPALISQLGMLHNKGRSVAAYILNVEAESEMIGNAIKAMQKRKKSADRRADALRRYLAENMRVVGIESIKSEDGTFEVRLYPGRDEAVEITDEKALDDGLCAFQRVPNKTLISASIKAGLPVAGAHLVRRDRLTIA